MNVRNCKRCRRLFNYIAGPPVCPACRDEIEKEFQKVKKYIEENKDRSVTEVAEACEVDVQQIKQWVREERLQFSENSMVGLNCERCGVMIRSGRYCDKCKAEMTSSFNNAIGRNHPAQAITEDNKRSSSAKMRYLEN